MRASVVLDIWKSSYIYYYSFLILLFEDFSRFGHMNTKSYSFFTWATTMSGYPQHKQNTFRLHTITETPMLNLAKLYQTFFFNYTSPIELMSNGIQFADKSTDDLYLQSKFSLIWHDSEIVFPGSAYNALLHKYLMSLE